MMQREFLTSSSGSSNSSSAVSGSTGTASTTNAGSGVANEQADNKGLVPGLLILVGLIIAGSVTLLIGGITNSRRSNRESEKVA